MVSPSTSRADLRPYTVSHSPSQPAPASASLRADHRASYPKYETPAPAPPRRNREAPAPKLAPSASSATWAGVNRNPHRVEHGRVPVAGPGLREDAALPTRHVDGRVALVVEWQGEYLVLVLPCERGVAGGQCPGVDVQVAGRGDRLVVGLPLGLVAIRHDQERPVREQLGDDASRLPVAQVVERQRSEQVVVEVGGPEPVREAVFQGDAHRLEPEDLVHGVLAEPLRLQREQVDVSRSPPSDAVTRTLIAPSWTTIRSGSPSIS